MDINLLHRGFTVEHQGTRRTVMYLDIRDWVRARDDVRIRCHLENMPITLHPSAYAYDPHEDRTNVQPEILWT